jgi:hypothetical protein
MHNVVSRLRPSLAPSQRYGQQTFQNQQQAQQQAFEDQQRRQQAQAQFGTQFGQQAFEDQQRRQQAAAQQQQGIASLYGTLANTQSALAGQYGNIGQLRPIWAYSS